MDNLESMTDEISLTDIVKAIVKRKILILSTISVFLVVAICYALMADRYYKSIVTALPVSEEENSSGKLGGISSLLGGGASGKAQFSMEVLKSRSITGVLIERHNLKKEIFSDSWDEASGRWNLNKDEKEPSLNSAISSFQKNNMNIDVDAKTGVVSVEIEWEDADKSVVIANDFVNIVNEFLRKKSINDSMSSMVYLKKQIVETKEVEIKEMLYGLIQKELQSMKIAESKKDYAFQVIDSAAFPELPSRPKRKLIVILAGLGGVLFGFILAIVMEFVWPKWLEIKESIK